MLILITELKTQNMILMNKTVHDKCLKTFAAAEFSKTSGCELFKVG